MIVSSGWCSDCTSGICHSQYTLESIPAPEYLTPGVRCTYYTTRIYALTKVASAPLRVIGREQFIRVAPANTPSRPPTVARTSKPKPGMGRVLEAAVAPRVSSLEPPPERGPVQLELFTDM